MLPANTTLELPSVSPERILESINEGLYVTDTTRRIIYWGKGAERITGWPASDVVGKRCHEDVLCHIDKDGHRLCGAEHCPLHRSMVTGESSVVPITVFAQTKSGERVPMQVRVAPLRDTDGAVIGGVETFRDLSPDFADISRASTIQRLALGEAPPADPRIRFTMHYIPHDMIGGDYFACEPLDRDRYAFLLADVTGHGVPAALYTMFLHSLWTAHKTLMTRPAEFGRVVSNQLNHLIREQEPFAVALCGLLDLTRGELRLVGAGNPPPLVTHADGSSEIPDVSGLPLGLMADAEYDEVVVPMRPGDTVLLFTDGATEVRGADGHMLGTDGLRRVLHAAGYPGIEPDLADVESRLLAASNRIRFDDDLTFVDIRMV